MHLNCINLQCRFKINNPQKCSLNVHQFGAAGYKVRGRRPKYISERGNEEIERTLENIQPFSIDVKGGGKDSKTI